MKRSSELIMGSAVLLCYAAFIEWLFCLACLENEFEYMALNPVIICILLLVPYYVNYVLSGRGTSLAVYCAVQLVLAALGALLYARTAVLEPRVTGPVALGCVVCAGGIVASAYMAADGVKQRTVAVCFDTVIVLLVLILLLGNYRRLPMEKTVMYTSFAAMAASLGALISARVSREDSEGAVKGDPAAGRILIAILFAVILALAVLIASFASEGFGAVSAAGLAALKWLFGIVKSAILTVGKILERFFRWLSQFVDNEPVEPGVPIAYEDGAGMMYGKGEAAIPAYMPYVAGAVVLLLIVVLLLKMRGERVEQASRAIRKRKNVKKKSGLAAAFCALFARMLTAVKYYVNYIRFRGTVPGLLAWCEKKAPRELKRRSGESGENFILRLAETVGQSDEMRQALIRFSRLVEQTFYSATPQPLPKDLYKKIREIKFT